MKQQKKVPARIDWNREIIVNVRKPMRIRVFAKVPISVALVTDRLAQAAKRKEDIPILREDVIFSVESREPVFEKTVSLKPGTYWFAIENQSDGEAEIELECTVLEVEPKVPAKEKPKSR